MADFECLTAAKEAELKDNLWKIAKFEKAIKTVRRPVACVMQAVVPRVASSPA